MYSHTIIVMLECDNSSLFACFGWFIMYVLINIYFVIVDKWIISG